MSDFSLQGVQAVKPSVLEETFNNVGEGFEDILSTLENKSVVMVIYQLLMHCVCTKMCFATQCFKRR